MRWVLSVTAQNMSSSESACQSSEKKFVLFRFGNWDFYCVGSMCVLSEVSGIICEVFISHTHHTFVHPPHTEKSCDWYQIRYTIGELKFNIVTYIKAKNCANKFFFGASVEFPGRFMVQLGDRIGSHFSHGNFPEMLYSSFVGR